MYRKCVLCTILTVLHMLKQSQYHPVLHVFNFFLQSFVQSKDTLLHLCHSQLKPSWKAPYTDLWFIFSTEILIFVFNIHSDVSSSQSTPVNDCSREKSYTMVGLQQHSFFLIFSLLQKNKCQCLITRCNCKHSVAWCNKPTLHFCLFMRRGLKRIAISLSVTFLLQTFLLYNYV